MVLSSAVFLWFLSTCLQFLIKLYYNSKFVVLSVKEINIVKEGRKIRKHMMYRILNQLWILNICYHGACFQGKYWNTDKQRPINTIILKVMSSGNVKLTCFEFCLICSPFIYHCLPMMLFRKKLNCVNSKIVSREENRMLYDLQGRHHHCCMNSAFHSSHLH